ncbi:MAG: indole-3-glycerol phosphate synthase TrpC [Pseudobdellovibrionaceae bacterium]|jgi:indole-3-glycerol phosphate synthase|nr:indole-3-glycerol phosphate synthase TrpC [Pseudobdellovibrionaceae bacterium]
MNTSPLVKDAQNVLNKICADKLEHVARTQHLIPEIVFRERAKFQPVPIGFCNAIRTCNKNNEPALIAEIKKASPSKGIIRADFDPVQIARTYQNAGATCLSVLTDQPYFKGADEDLEAVKSVARIPVIRKDFMLTPYQIVESRSLGADCILLIMAALTDQLSKELYQCATDLGMDVLVEIHDHEELDRALKLNPTMVGVNSRNLKTLEVDIQTAFDLLPHIPANVIRVAESGIGTYAELKSLYEAGYNAFLVGESLMRQENIGLAVQKLLGKAAESE